jgi:organic hydroperoxide reductase OsmC/OhrA
VARISVYAVLSRNTAIFHSLDIKGINMATTVMYETSARATGGRDGNSTTLDSSFSITLATPKELGGTGHAGNNPEQLFAAGYAACFLILLC